MPKLLLHKDEAVPLPCQISAIIRTRIETGEYLPGKRLKTIRQFASDFDVSPVTIVKALDILEEETLIERVPVKGVFVSNRLRAEKKQLYACFAFPEKGISPASRKSENWGLSSELYRGLLNGSQAFGMNLQFTYFQDDPSLALLQQQLMALKKFDFVIFTGWQLSELQKASAQERLTFCLPGGLQPASPDVIVVDYDRADARKRLAAMLQESGCSSAAVISLPKPNTPRGLDFLEDAQQAGIQVPQEGIWHFDHADPLLIEKLKEVLSRREAEFIFCDATDIMDDLYAAAYAIGQQPGKDLILTAIASGHTFAGLRPPPTFFRIPRYEMGLQIMEKAEQAIRRNEKLTEFPSFFVEKVSEKSEAAVTVAQYV